MKWNRNLKKTLFLLVLIVACGSVFSQEYQINSNLGSFSPTDWTRKKVNKQVSWYQLKSGELFAEPQSINVLRINLKKQKYEVSMVYSDSTLVLLSEMANGQNALAAINGTFFDTKNGGSVLFLKVDDEIVTHPNPNAKEFISEAAFVVGDSAHVVEFPKNDWQNWHRNYEDIMVSGPLLVKNGMLVEPDTVVFNTTKHPRSAIGITSDYELLMVAADGRHENKAVGLSIKELGILMQALGCKEAMNLDGGGSTTLWLKMAGVVNYPSDNKKFDHEGARAIANGVVVFRN
ncbi:phosphodiester glycosidase family protein [Maribellus sediminis]|uniref:phosphodiester glycosidase family protein n=1 Tax=Maribellus sediminis TaxID=2696285 RepID=UPI0014300BD4|nr:phosphodiester glycosidase family protein [Maribellus sediminis]